ncbi:4Fe-4S dicluster domain-containing protein [Pseudodesulfovibrio sp. JC047]|uniref:4Fe-4S dicluster domain-containing protein n=1 Tax=Pseudodesulfovibrio sp. JC047 TaxID=2683199 RepID=UPI0013D31B5E|nr:4Fe-4S dicluster domain-containing protein [Pseudodesulfovibrio sp. JC047]NDV18591.1 4Fe-4S dicluster domain-containing protein [Pseudodesulfovibrio sp. JC047]
MKTQTTHSTVQAEIPLSRCCPLVTCGQAVKQGERIATSNVPEKGDIHAPFAGKVVHVDPFRIRIDQEEGDTVQPVSFDGLNAEELSAKLHELGADIPPSTDVDTLIFNAVDAEQGIVSRRTLLQNAHETLERGAQALADVYHPMTTTMAVVDGVSTSLNKATTHVISEQYPAGLDPLVAKAVTGIEAPEKTLVIGLETVFHVGRIMETGLPVMETMVTIQENGKLVPLGTPVGAILDEAHEPVNDHDRIILGGVLRGTAAASPTQGVDRATSAVTVISNPAPVAQDAACVGCGECVRRCPARLDPAMITSYAEFGMYDKAAAAHVGTCFECGLCGFFCIAHRPMLQYIRLAKSELAMAAAQAGEEN